MLPYHYHKAHIPFTILNNAPIHSHTSLPIFNSYQQTFFITTALALASYYSKIKIKI